MADGLPNRDTDVLEVPWGARQVFYGLLMAVGLLVLAIGVGIGVSLLWISAELPEVSTTTIVQLVFALEALLLVPPWLLGPRKYRLSWSSLGLRHSSLLGSVAVTMVGFGLVLVANWGWTLVMGRFNLQLTEQPNPLPYFGGGITGLLMALLLGAVVAPVAEEIFFRGFLYPGLRRSWGTGWALLASAALFAVIHGFTAVIPPIFVIGLVLAISYEITGSLWPAILIHAAMNALAFISAYIVSVGGAELGF